MTIDCSSPPTIFQKSPLTIMQTRTITPSVPCPPRDASRSSRRVGRGMRWTLWRQAGSFPPDENAGSGRRSRVVLAPRPWRHVGGVFRRQTGARKAASPGRARRKPLKPSRGESRCELAEPVVTNSCAFLYCTRGCGRGQRPAFPAPSAKRRDNEIKTQAKIAS